jgi:replicative DNA helicase
VWGLYREAEKDATGKTKRDDYGRPILKAFDASGNAPAYLVIEKNRHGAGSRVNLRFNGAMQLWRET